MALKKKTFITVRRLEYMLMVIMTAGLLQLFMFPFRFTLYQSEMSYIESSHIQFAQRRPNISQDECTHLIQDQPFTETHFKTQFLGVKIYPKSKLIICIPAKAGSSLDHDIRRDLNQLLPVSNQIKSWVPNRITALNYNTSYHFCNDSWTKIFIVRDPLSRLLSGYLDKCTETTFPFWKRDTTEGSTDSYHFHCDDFLLSLGIDTRYIMNHPDEYQANPERYRGSPSKNNVGAFTQFLLKQYREDERSDHIQRTINDQFSLMRIHGGIQYGEDLVRGWNVWNSEDKATWDWIFRRQIANNSLLRHWFDIQDKKHLDPLKPDDVPPTLTQSDMLQYYKNDEILYHALKYVWRDYHVFNIKIPKWICGVIRERVRAFLRVYFVHKRYLLPECVLE